MAFRNSVIIVASPRPRAGKTMLARLLVDYYAQEKREVSAFDLSGGDDSLARFLPGQVTVSDIDNVSGQMALFDLLITADDAVKIVDVGHEIYETFFSIAYRIGFADEARKRGIAPVILFMMSADRPSTDAYRQMGERFRRATLSPVHNEILGAVRAREKYPPSGLGAAMMRLPALTPGLRRYVETPPFSFADTQLANARNIPLDVHIELQRWLRKVHLEFRELDLRVLLADLQSSIRLE
jgi:hypothetical protein